MPREYTKTQFTYQFFIPPDKYGNTLIKALKKIKTLQLYNLWDTDTTDTVHVAIESSLAYHLKKYYEKACAKLGHLKHIKEKHKKNLRPNSISKKPKSIKNDKINSQVKRICADCTNLSAKSIRQFFATKYVQQTAEDNLLGRLPGPNPLNHQNISMTITRYAKHDAANREEACKRLV